MTELKVIRTTAEQGLVDAFAGARATLPGSGAVKSLRENAFHAFEAKGLPHRRVEEWKYTDLRALMRDAKPLAPPPDAAGEARGEIRGRLPRSREGAADRDRGRRIRRRSVRPCRA